MGVVVAEVTFGGGVAEANAGGVFLLELLMLLMELRTFEKLFCTTSFFAKSFNVAKQFNQIHHTPLQTVLGLSQM